METFLRDLHYSLRLLLKAPAFTTVAVLSLALGIGANISIFSFVNAFLLRPLPVKDPGQLVALYCGNSDHLYGGNSYLDYVDYRQQNDVFSDLIAFWRMAPVNLSTHGQSERVWGSIVSGNYFSTLGVKAIMGRTFLPEEDQTPGTHPVAVISYGLWQRRFGSDPALIGNVIRLNGCSFTVVGVVPKDFKGTTVGLSSEIWVPLMMQAQVMPAWNLLNERGIHVLFIVGRLKPEVTLEQARASVNILARRVEQAHPSQPSRWTMTLVPISRVDPEFDRSLFSVAGLLAALVGLVLLLACTNVATLLIARASVRQRELAIRIAVGATRSQLIRQLLTESTLLSLLGGAGGLALAFWTTDLLSAFKLPYFVPITLDLKLETGALTFALVLSLSTGILFGLAPALHASSPNRVNPLRGKPMATSLTGRRFGLRSLLVIAQIAVSVVLLIVAGLFVRSFRKAQTTNPSFNPNNVLATSLDPKLDGYSAALTKILHRQLVERVGSLPGVQSVSLARMAPLDLMRLSSGVAAEEQPPSAEESRLIVSTNSVTPRYFETLGIPLLFGRDFNDHDGNEAPRVAIVNEAMAHRLWPGQDAIGRRIVCGDNKFEVVGVVKNGIYENWGKQVHPYLFTPLAQNDAAVDFPITLLLRTLGDPKDTIAAIRSQVRSLDKHLVVFDIKTMTEQIHRTLSLPRMGAMLTGMFGLLGLVLAVIGIYGVVSYTTTCSTHEIGIRTALGAERHDVIKLILTQGMVLTLIGLAIGLAASLTVTRVLSNLLFGVTTNDPLTFVSVPVFLTTAALWACYVPARRAANVDPMVALRHE